MMRRMMRRSSKPEMLVEAAIESCDCLLVGPPYIIGAGVESLKYDDLIR